ncbi:MAG: PQQ-binding-like beta-propeller repeat protein, partial [Abditibacteriales bacterium]|nr:PQQ-binding-like beta-propeller repeat protein [Abditibacteriales bacterium]
MNRCLLLPASLLVCLLTSFSLGAKDGQGVHWPQFRGPRASGIAEGFPTPTTWNVAASQNVRWKTPIPGLAHSSPTIWGDKLFLTTAISGRA